VAFIRPISAVSAEPARPGAIVYLAVFGSALGFVLYYYVLRNVQATRVTFITLITPVIALILGQWGLVRGRSAQSQEAG